MMNEIKLIEIKKIGDGYGDLSFIEKNKEINFDIRRIYWIYNLNKGVVRGKHAHKELKQVMFCPFGEIKVIFFKNNEKTEYILNSPNKILVINKGYWREFEALIDKSILCVGASKEYKEADYIRNYEEYITWEGDENTDKR